MICSLFTAVMKITILFLLVISAIPLISHNVSAEKVARRDLERSVKMTVLVDKFMQPQARWTTKEWMIKATAEADFNVFSPRRGHDRLDEVRQVTEWCNIYGIYHMPRMRGSLSAPDGAEADGKRLVWASGNEQPLWSPNSDEFWYWTNSFTIEYAKISTQNEHLIVCMLAIGDENAGEMEMAQTTHLVSMIDVKDFGAETLRIGDLSGDGSPDLLFVQSIYGTREITCLTATTIYGDILWQHGMASSKNGRIYSDLPVQIYDWDADGQNEVLYVRQARYVESSPWGGWARERASSYEGDATMVILNGMTGQEKGKFPLPAPADDCFLFADLTGHGRRLDLVVKDRYWNMWGVAHDGSVLWHWEGSTGHFPAIADVDNDGRDEVFVGFALIDHDGKVVFERDSGGAHQDASYIIQLPDGTWRLLFGNSGIHCLTPDGSELWHHPLSEAQHVVAGRFRPDLEPIQFMVIDRGQPVADGKRGPAKLYLYDLDGREIWLREQPEGSWVSAIVEIDWSGKGYPQEVLVYNRGQGNPAAIYDGSGNIVDTAEMRYLSENIPEDQKTYYCTRADVWGDSRQEVIFFGPRGACIYTNARPMAIPTLYNNTLYPGM